MSPASAKSDGSASALSIGSGSQKPGKLQRLLSLTSLSKGPPTVHATHVEEKADIPSVPQEVEAKLHEHTGLFPITTKRLALKTQLSKDTLMTIFSVGSLEVHNIDPQPAVSPLSDRDDTSSPEPKISSRRHTFQAVPSSIAHAAAAVLPLRKPVARKPLPARKAGKKEQYKDEAAAENILDVEAELTTYSMVNTSLGNNPYDAAFMAMNDEREAYFSPVGRSMSMTAQLERNLDVRMAATKTRAAAPELALLSPSLPSPAFSEIPPQKRSKTTPPPVTMNTQRRPIPLRVPPPLRPQSTPPIAQSLSRQGSRESIHGAPRKQSTPNREDTISPPAIPPMNPRRSLNLQDPRSPQSPYRAPNWEVQTDHGSRRGSIDNSRSNSLTARSQASPAYPPQQRPPNMQPNAQGPNAPRPLRHRASYDGYSNGQRQSWDGHTPQVNSHPKPSLDPWSNPHKGSAAQQWDQNGRYPPYVPRGHYRNRSMGNQQSHSRQPPYRILHSYNSPAYRGVPIWG